MTEKQNFFRNHIDTMIIIGVNLVIGAVLILLWWSTEYKEDSSYIEANARMDKTQKMIHDLLKEGRK